MSSKHGAQNQSIEQLELQRAEARTRENERAESAKKRNEQTSQKKENARLKVSINLHNIKN